MIAFYDITCSWPGAFLVGLLAAGLAWRLNTALSRMPAGRLVWLAPMVEETAKTLPAVFFGADIFFTHFFFGAAEGAWELFSDRRNGFYAGLSALVSHSIFGAATVFVYNLYGYPALALGTGYLAHAAWNYMVVEYLPARKSRAGR